MKARRVHDSVRQHSTRTIFEGFTVKDTHGVGNIAEIEVTRSLIRAGYIVSHPFGEGCKYDLVADKGDKLLRVQVKTGSLKEGAVRSKCFTVARSGENVSYKDFVDAYGIYCADTDKTYLVPVEDAPTMELSLRVLATKNNQSTGVRWAKDYEII